MLNLVVICIRPRSIQNGKELTSVSVFHELLHELASVSVFLEFITSYLVSYNISLCIDEEEVQRDLSNLI